MSLCSIQSVFDWFRESWFLFEKSIFEKNRKVQQHPLNSVWKSFEFQPNSSSWLTLCCNPTQSDLNIKSCNLFVRDFSFGDQQSAPNVGVGVSKAAPNWHLQNCLIFVTNSLRTVQFKRKTPTKSICINLNTIRKYSIKFRYDCGFFEQLVSLSANYRKWSWIFFEPRVT